MKATSTIVALTWVCLTLPFAELLQLERAEDVVASKKCACDPNNSLPHQLIRGEREVDLCKRGRYCDCNNSKPRHCLNIWGVGYKFDEVHQKCRFSFGCAAFFSISTPAPVPGTTTVPPSTRTPECKCEIGKPQLYQLIRGPDEVQLCNHGRICRCNNRTIIKCPNVWENKWDKFNEVDQKCQPDFSCEEFFGITTSEPVPRPTTETPITTVAPECECQSGNSMPYQLSRAYAKIDLCLHGRYCQCSNGKMKHCFNVWGLRFKFDEVSQKCRFGFDCYKFFDPTRAPTSTTEPVTLTSPTVTPRTTVPTTSTMTTTVVTTSTSTATIPTTASPTTVPRPSTSTTIPTTLSPTTVTRPTTWTTVSTTSTSKTTIPTSSTPKPVPSTATSTHESNILAVIIVMISLNSFNT